MALPAAGQNPTAAMLADLLAAALVSFSGMTDVVTSETTGSTSYTDLATAGPSISITGRGTVAFAIWSIVQSSTSGSAVSSVAVSGATTLAASDNYALIVSDSSRSSIGWARLAVNAGSNTYKLRYRVTAGTGTFHTRRLMVWAP